MNPHILYQIPRSLCIGSPVGLLHPAPRGSPSLNPNSQLSSVPGPLEVVPGKLTLVTEFGLAAWWWFGFGALPVMILE